MLVPVKWLKDYVDINDLDIKTLEDGLILSGSNTECVNKSGDGVEKVVVGKIESIDQHPDADKLVVCQINVGEETLQIVTGATNVNVGDYIPVALVGAKLPNGLKIKKGKLRGVESNGMLCSLEELGFGDNVIPKKYSDGILILDKEYTLGANILTELDVDDHVIEFEITPNRPDCLSMIGMARETSATFDRSLKLPSLSYESISGDVNDFAKISVLDTELCPRFSAKVVKDVTVKESPMWLQMKLMKAGMRPTNNIVDITNFVMLEYGQPIHAYDLNTLNNGEIIVRRAHKGEKIVTLDDKERNLHEDTLVIADSSKAIGIAGIMGGDETEVKDHTTDLLIEVASFNKSSIRETSKKVGLRTEASSRFEKGIDPNTTEKAINRVCELIVQLEAGKIVNGLIDIYPNKVVPNLIELRATRVKQVLGIDLNSSEISDLLTKLEMKVEDNGDVLVVEVPTFRLDLVKEIDLIEEIARLYGYDKITPTLPADSMWGALTNGQNIEKISKEVLMASGLNEICTYSFVSPSTVDKIRLNENSLHRNMVKLRNPLGEEYSVMRTTLLPNMLEVLEKNFKREVQVAEVVEIGNIFLPRELPVKTAPIEKRIMNLGLMGGNYDFYYMKGIIENLFDVLGIKEYKYMAETNNDTYHPGRCANIVWDNHILGTIGEVHPLVLEGYDIRTKVVTAEIDFNILLQLSRIDRLYKPLPKYPSSSRDIAVVVNDDVAAGSIREFIIENGTKLLESCSIFDVYKGSQIPEGKKSVAYSLNFRSMEGTLTDEEVNKVYEKLIKLIEEKFNASLR